MSHEKPARKRGGRGCAGPTKITSRNRFCSSSAIDLTPEEIAFASAMAAYRAKWGRANSTCGEILDVLMDLGYRHQERDFELCVVNFTHAVASYKKKSHKKFPTWSEVLSVAASLGWARPTPS